MENHPEQIWTTEMLELLLRMKEVRDKAVFMSKESLSYYHTNRFKKCYMSIIEKARNLNPLPEKIPGKRGRVGKGKIRSLIERLFDYKESVCLFVKNFKVGKCNFNWNEWQIGQSYSTDFTRVRYSKNEVGDL